MASPPSLGTCPMLAESSHVTRLFIRAGSGCSKLSSAALRIGEALFKAYIPVRMLRSWRQPRSRTDAAPIPVRLKSVHMEQIGDGAPRSEERRVGKECRS